MKQIHGSTTSATIVIRDHEPGLRFCPVGDRYHGCVVEAYQVRDLALQIAELRLEAVVAWRRGPHRVEQRERVVRDFFDQFGLLAACDVLPRDFDFGNESALLVHHDLRGVGLRASPIHFVERGFHPLGCALRRIFVVVNFARQGAEHVQRARNHHGCDQQNRRRESQL